MDNMSDKIPPNEWFIKVGIAVLGGCARLAWELLTGKKHTLMHFILRGVVSVFIGAVCFHILPRNSEVGFAITGLLSWMGADGVSFLIEVIRQRKGDK